MNKKIYIIGITDKFPEFNVEQVHLLKKCMHFAGGKRHYQLVKTFLPSNAIWKDIVVPLKCFFEELRKSSSDWVVFASGDPLFFGIGNSLKREMPETEITVYPTFNSLQMLGHRLQKNYGEYKIVTLTGRPWKEFDKALINGEPKIALLTDRKKTPSTIAKRMLDAGIDNYTMHVGECLGGKNEQVCSLSLEEVKNREFAAPNCLFLQSFNTKVIQKGIPESYFETLPGRPKMITKMPVRMSTLAFMQLHAKTVLWDVGACSGSVSIEAKLNYPHLEVLPFEIRPECENIINNNKKGFYAIGIEPIIGDFLKVNKQELPCPDAVFLGGYGGKMNEILDQINNFLPEKGIIAFNSVSEKSEKTFLNWVNQNNYILKVNTSLKADYHNPIKILIAEK